VPLDVLITDPNIPVKGTPMGDAYRKDIRYCYACMTGVDDQLDSLFTYLKETTLDQNTIILFTSDHGNCLG
jgi:arylsulfatase A-like enzyme